MDTSAERSPDRANILIIFSDTDGCCHKSLLGLMALFLGEDEQPLQIRSAKAKSDLAD